MAIAIAVVTLGLPDPAGSATTDSVDELHYSFGNDAASVVFDWHGAETSIYYGLDSSYGQVATATNPPILPRDEAGPFREVSLSGLQPGATYHYKIGVDGLDHTFAPAPTGDYNSVDIGDSLSSFCAPSYMPQLQQLIAAQNPAFVTHGGDISYANECGVPAIHSFYTDIEAWSHSAAFQISIGNHEYGPPSASAPAGTPTDTLANYKGRDRMSNAQTVPNDTVKQVKHPGCGTESGSTTNTCLGDDWGWFSAGQVLYISYPEPESGAIADWQMKADVLMARAQADPSVDFVITYGHRPAYTDSNQAAQLDLRAALDALAKQYSPDAANLNGLYGKYVMNIQHHAHNFEAFAPKNGLTYITDAAGGDGFTNWVSPLDPDSVYRLRHLGVLVTRYNADAHSLQASFVCGPDYTTIKDRCTYGQTMWSTTIVRPDSNPPPPDTTPPTVTVTSPAAGSTQSGSVTVTADANDDVAVASVAFAVDGKPLAVNSTSPYAATLDTATLSNAAHDLTATATDTGGNVQTSAPVTFTVANVAPTTACSPRPAGVDEFSANPSLETNQTGWTGVYNGTSAVTRSQPTGGSYDGKWALTINPKTGSSGTAGVNNVSPYWVPGPPGAATVAGRKYTAGAVVRGSVAGKTVTVLLRETTKSGTGVSYSSATVTLPDTAWRPVTTTYTARQSGDVLRYSLYASNFVNSGQYLLADCLSVQAPHG